MIFNTQSNEKTDIYVNVTKIIKKQKTKQEQAQK